jgi:hypothetical protein
MQLVIDAGGSILAIYDELIDLSVLGHLSIVRASHVEPDAQGQWRADLGPVGGPILGPFLQRSQALIAERCWLEGRLCAGGSLELQAERTAPSR